MTGRAWSVSAGAVMRVVDLEGSQVADVFLVDAGDVTDGLSNGRTFDCGGTLSLTTGAQLYSSRSRLLATIVRDDVGAHDILYAPCSQAMFERQYGVTAPHPNCYENLTNALGRVRRACGDGHDPVQRLHAHDGRARRPADDPASTLAPG